MERKTNKKDATSGGFFDLTHTNNYILHVYSGFSVFFFAATYRYFHSVVENTLRITWLRKLKMATGVVGITSFYHVKSENIFLMARNSVHINSLALKETIVQNF